MNLGENRIEKCGFHGRFGFLEVPVFRIPKPLLIEFITASNAHVNPEHENKVKEILQEELPDVAISTSSEILPEIFEHERFSTTVANAVLAPLVGNYARTLAERMRDGGYEGDVLLLHSGGRGHDAARLASSGLAAGAIAGGH